MPGSGRVASEADADVRLHRNYPLKKIQENNEAEIMEVVLDEAR